MSVPILGYGQAAETYWQLGWHGILPLPEGQKQWPPRGFTGNDGDYPSYADVLQWREMYPNGNLALRMADDELGLDVDHHGGKTGGDSITKAEKALGKLPFSARSTSRADDINGIRLYRVPAGRTWRWPVDRFGGGIDILQRSHRYAVVWPSIHPDTKRQYRWLGPDDQPVSPPRADELPELPTKWVEALSEPAVPDTDYGTFPAPTTLTAGEPEGRVQHILDRAIKAIHSPNGCRFDATRDNVLALMRCGKDGDHGVQRAIDLLRFEYVEAVHEKRGGRRVTTSEFDRMVNGHRVAQLLAVPSYSEWFASSATSTPAGRPASPASSATAASSTTEEDTTMTDPEPTPLTTAVPVPTFPVDALPGVIADKVAALAEATQTDPAMAGSCGLLALSTCTGGHAQIEIRRGWREPLNLFCVPIAAPGERKSAVHASMIRPILQIESEMAFNVTVERLLGEDQSKLAKKLADKLTTEAAKLATAAEMLKIKRDTTDGAEEIKAATKEYRDAKAIADKAAEAAQEATSAAREIEVPPVLRLIADDITPEAIGSLLAENHGRIAILSAEGGVFDTLAGRYAKLVNLDTVLKAHAGDTIKVDRQSQPPVYVPNPALTLGVMIQPRVLETLANNLDFSGRGFLARILYARPRSNVGHRAIAATPVSENIESRYAHDIQKLAAGMAQWVDSPAVLTLTTEAELAFRAIEERIEHSLGGGGELASSPGLVEWGSKLAGVTARIAGILHLGEHGPAGAKDRPVQVETIRAAERIGEYFRACAIGVFTEMILDPGTRDAVWLLGRVQHLGRDEVSQRDLHVASRSRFPKVSDMVPALNRLITNGHLIELPSDPPNLEGGRPPSPKYRVHPATHNSQNAQNLSR